MLLKFVNLLLYWKTKNATLFLGYKLWKQTHSKWAKQKKSFKLIRRLLLLKFVNRPFAGSGHMVQNKLHWDANDAVGLPKQSTSYQSSPTSVCFESPTASFASSVIYSVPCDRILQRAYLLFHWKPKKATLFTWTFLGKPNPFKMGEEKYLLVFFLCFLLFYAKNDFLKSNQWLLSQIAEADDFDNENVQFTELLLQSHISFSLIYTEQLRKFKVKGLRGCLYLGADTINWMETSRHICVFNLLFS